MFEETKNRKKKVQMEQSMNGLQILVEALAPGIAKHGTVVKDWPLGVIIQAIDKINEL